jgi:Flp pilus assembly protein TadG
MPVRWILVTLLGRIASNDRGVAAVEFALILPVMLVLYFGTYEASNLVRAYLATNRAAQAMANLMAQHDSSKSVTQADTQDICVAGQLAMAPFPVLVSVGTNGNFKATIESVVNNQATGVISFYWAQPDTTCGGKANAFANVTAAANGLVPNKGDSVIVVKVEYDYTSPLHFVLPPSFTIVQTASQRPRTNGAIPHG